MASLAGAPAEQGRWGVVPTRAKALTRPLFSAPDESSEEEDEEDELEEEEDEAAGGYRLGPRERALSPGLEESGLGLLARFAASALPSPTVGPSLSVVQLEAKQKARKKEERQNLMGKYRQVDLEGRRCPILRTGNQGSGEARSRAGGPVEPCLVGPHPEQSGPGDVGPARPRRGRQSSAGDLHCMCT